MNCEQYYVSVNKSCESVIKKSLKDGLINHQAKAHSFIEDIECWKKVLENRKEAPILNIALVNYQAALFAVVQGQYRQAYSALRMFLEQIIAGVYLSTNEIELRKWLNNSRDIYWSELIDYDKGIFSCEFINLFFPDLIKYKDEYYVMTKDLYRECSEYIHANLRTHVVANLVSFKESVYLDFHCKVQSACRIFTFIFSMRYRDMIAKNHKKKLEQSINDYLGNLSEIQKFFE